MKTFMHPSCVREVRVNDHERSSGAPFSWRGVDKDTLGNVDTERDVATLCRGKSCMSNRELTSQWLGHSGFSGHSRCESDRQEHFGMQGKEGRLTLPADNQSKRETRF